MQTSKLAVAVMIALATTGGVAANAVAADEKGSTASSDRIQFQAGDRELYSEQEKAKLDRAGFPQYTN